MKVAIFVAATFALTIDGFVRGQTIYREMSGPEIYDMMQISYKRFYKQNQALKQQLRDVQRDLTNVTGQKATLEREISSLREKQKHCTECEDGWVQSGHSCYLFPNKIVTFSDALSACKAAGSNLLENLSASLVEAITAQGISAVWIGATDNITEGIFRYESSGTTVCNGDWDVGQPNSERNENCVVARSSYNWKWHDYPCSDKFYYVCKKSNAIL